jgi:WxL Interacting Protein, peptidoglycan binding domain
VTVRARLLVPALAVVAAVGAALPGGALAARSPASFALQPDTYDPALPATKSYFIVAASPGAVVKDRVRVVNAGKSAGTAFLYAVDATTGQTSGAVYRSRQAPKRDVGAWIDLGRSKVTLGAGASALVPFTIRVPATARPGDHLGGIVAENAALTDAKSGGALQITIRHLTIDAVEVQVPGHVSSGLAVTKVSAGGGHGYQYVYVHLRNTGTVMVKPVGSLLVRDAGGHAVARQTLRLDTLVPGTAIDYPVLLPGKVLRPGRYTARVVLSSGKGRVLGYRKAEPAPVALTRTFAFTVSASDQKTVYSGAAPVTPPPAAAAGTKNHAGTGLVVPVLAGLAVLCLLAVVALLVRLALARRRRTGSPSLGEPEACQRVAPEPAASPHEREAEEITVRTGGQRLARELDAGTDASVGGGAVLERRETTAVVDMLVAELEAVAALGDEAARDAVRAVNETLHGPDS